MSRNPSPAEVRSWDASLTALSADLRQAGLSGVEALIEYQLPLSSKRIDVVLAGEHPGRGGPSYVVVELKQWSRAELFEDEPELVLQPSYGRRPVLHPVAQVRAYCEYLQDFENCLHGSPDLLAGAAYLHNAMDDEVDALLGYLQDEWGRLFTSRDRGAFIALLQARLAPTNASVHADRLLRSAHSPSKQLLAVAAAEIRTREQFVLLDEQRVAYDLVLQEGGRPDPSLPRHDRTSLGLPCNRHGASAGEPCWELGDNSPPVCTERVRESQRQQEGAQ